MAASTPRRDRSWALALLASLVLHAGIGLLLALVPGPDPGAGPSGSMLVDACGLEEGTTYLTADSDAGPMQAVLIAPPVAAEPLVPSRSPSENIAHGEIPAGSPEAGNKQAAPAGGGDASPFTQGADAPRSVRAAEAKRGNGTTFFNVKAQGQTFVYAIDRSASMGPCGGLRAAREELLASLQQLPPSARFQVIVYNRSAEPLLPARVFWLDATPDNIRQVAARLDGLVAEGGTDHLPALRRSLALRPDVLFFLTDADDLAVDLLRTVTQLNAGRRTAIHAIELTSFHRDRLDLPMHLLALENRGTYRAVDLQSHHE